MALFEGNDPPEIGNPFTMRAPCLCGETSGRVLEVNGQDTVRCVHCNRFQYNAPRTETGRRVRSISERPGLKPKVRSRILKPPTTIE